MKRPDWTKTHPKNTETPVPEIHGKAKSGKEKANPMVAGTDKVWHMERPIPENAWGPMDNDLARDNLEQDIPFADLQDL
jgi:hypothetical protein